MDPSQIEQWTADVVRQVLSGKTVEDARVELKSVPPEPSEAAKQIGALINAARGAWVLYVVGVDERHHALVDLPADWDPAHWWPAVAKHFDETSPRPDDLRVSVGDGVVAVLAFPTNLKPFVLKTGGGKGPHRWVPWRVGTAQIAARRQDLVELISQRRHVPAVHIVEHATWFGQVRGAAAKDTLTVRHNVSLLVEPADGPVHLAQHETSWSMMLVGAGGCIATERGEPTFQFSGRRNWFDELRGTVQPYDPNPAVAEDNGIVTVFRPAVLHVEAELTVGPGDEDGARVMFESTASIEVAIKLGFIAGVPSLELRYEAAPTTSTDWVFRE